MSATFAILVIATAGSLQQIGAPLTWHPRDSAYPIAWQMRNGRWGEVFAEIRQRHLTGRMTSAVEFVLLEGGKEVAAYASGDDAAAVAWVRYLERRRSAGAVSTVTDAEVARRVIGNENNAPAHREASRGA